MGKPSGANPALVNQAATHLGPTGFDPGEGLLALAERCEAATGPDRSIDVTIFAILCPDKFDDAEHARQYATAEYQRVMNRADWYYLGLIGLPLFTASLDAALTLVPEGCGWRIWAPASGSREQFRATIWTWRFMPLFAPFDVEAATPALALCAAALRAIAMSAGTAETQSGSGLQPASSGLQGIAPNLSPPSDKDQ